MKATKLKHVLLSVEQMRAADAAAIASGVAGYTLMCNAGRAVADYITAHYSQRPLLVLAGPGNNGGDGFVIARLLQQAGWTTKVALFGDVAQLKGDAAQAAADYHGGSVVAPNEIGDYAEGALLVDALFGTGLTRPIEGELAAIITAIAPKPSAIIAVDIPSGVNGNSGAVMGVALKADATITFAGKKYGHLLLPGRDYCGEVITADIGIGAEILAQQEINIFANHPDLWQALLPFPQAQSHKYQRGHALVVGGEVAAAQTTGAARLAAYAALRAGAGLVSIACSPQSLPVYAADCRAVMTKEIAAAPDFENLLADKRINSWLIGPGCGVSLATKTRVKQIISANKAVVLDADALSVFEDEPQELFALLQQHNNCVLTPHEGEFARLFAGEIAADTDMDMDKLQRARAAARLGNCVIVLKGSDSVIAAADGMTVINHNAPPWLATAGSGDVLAGMICGLMAQGMPAFAAAAAAVWMHGQAAEFAGIGMISEDLPHKLPQVWQGLEIGAC